MTLFKLACFELAKYVHPTVILDIKSPRQSRFNPNDSKLNKEVEETNGNKTQIRLSL